MPTVDFTLDDLKTIFATKDDFGIFAATVDSQIDGIKNDLQSFATKDDLAGFATKADFGVLSSQVKVIQDGMYENNALILRVKTMLEEDFRAESTRVDKIDRRLTKVERRLDQNIAESTR